MNTIFHALVTTCCLLSAAGAQRLITAGGNTFYSVDPVTAQLSPIVTMPAGAGTVGGLAYDSATNQMFFASTSSQSLYTVNLGTGAWSLVGAFGDPASIMHGIELDASSGQLYGCSSHNGGFYAISRTTGAATLVGLTGLAGITNLAHDAATNTLYATNTFTDSVYTVDRSNGALTLVGPLQNSVSPQALAFRADTGGLYMLDHLSDQLYAVDPATGTAHVVGSTGPGNLLALAFVPGGNGSLQRQAHGCGNATIFAHGDVAIGGRVTVQLGGITGVPLIGFGVAPSALPFCGCTLGHEWAVAVAGAAANLNIPSNVGLVGVQVGMQGLDLFGVGGCADPAIVLTDTMVLTIG